MADEEEESPEQSYRNERLQYAIEHETIEAMERRYADYGAPIDKTGYVRGPGEPK